MAEQQAVMELVDTLETERFVQPDRFFALMRRVPGVANIAYVDAAVSPAGMSIHRLHHTFGSSFERLYISRGYNRIDPVLKMTLSGIRPVEWSQARKRHPESEPLFQALASRGLPQEGIAFPLVSRARRSAMLSVNIDTPASLWPSYRRSYSKDLQHIALLFHASLAESDAVPHAHNLELVALTYRETEVLAWAAAGKSYWEIAVILGITERTVRHFMSNARTKLNVVSNTQAVAQAVWRNLIPPF